MATSTPLSSIAFTMAKWESGTAPACQASPSMNMLVAMASPMSAVAISRCFDEMALGRASPICDRLHDAPHRQRVVRIVGEGAGIGLVAVDEDRGVRRGSMAASALADPATTASPPMRRSAPPAAMRTALIASGREAMRTWLVTGPPFCASPVMSTTAAALPSRCAAIASTAADGDDPGAADAGEKDGVGAVERRQGRRIGTAHRLPVPARSPCGTAPCTVTKLGQKPLRQEKSLLQADWSMTRLRPNSVSSGWIATQFDWTPQSPQPSQTSSLMSTRWLGAGSVPRFRRRRISAAQVWS